jgi:hypothetical protein
VDQLKLETTQMDQAHMLPNGNTQNQFQKV